MNHKVQRSKQVVALGKETSDDVDAIYHLISKLSQKDMSPDMFSKRVSMNMSYKPLNNVRHVPLKMFPQVLLSKSPIRGHWTFRQKRCR